VFFGHENRMDSRRAEAVMLRQLLEALSRFEGCEYLPISIRLGGHFDPV
jgi:hypothetical protein